MSKNNNHSHYQTYKWKEDKLISKDNCFECGIDGELHYHHIVPETLGGTKTIPLCLICHGKVHNKNFVNQKELQRKGIEKAKLEGKFLGRKPGTVDTPENYLRKEKNKNIIELVKKGYSYSIISKELNVSKTTVTKTVKVYENHYCLKIQKSKLTKEEVDIKIPNWMME